MAVEITGSGYNSKVKLYNMAALLTMTRSFQKPR